MFEYLKDYYMARARAESLRYGEGITEQTYRYRAQRRAKYWESMANILSIGQTLFDAYNTSRLYKREASQYDDIIKNYIRQLNELGG